MITARRGFQALAIDKKIIVFGGTSPEMENKLKDGEEYDPITNTWTMLEPMEFARSYCSIVKPS